MIFVSTKKPRVHYREHVLAMRIEANALLDATILNDGQGTLLVVLLLPCFSETGCEIILAPCPEACKSPSLPCSLRLFNQLMLDVVCFCEPA